MTSLLLLSRGHLSTASDNYPTPQSSSNAKFSSSLGRSSTNVRHILPSPSLSVGKDYFKNVQQSRSRPSFTSLPLSINKIYRRMYCGNFGCVGSLGGASSGLVVRRYAVPLQQEKNKENPSTVSPNSPQRLHIFPRNRCKMGAFLDKPRTEKSNECGQGAGLRFGIAAMQGWRIEMEDAHTARAGNAMPPQFQDWAFFAIFDGHAGCKVARHCAQSLLESIWSTADLQELCKQSPSLQKLDNKQVEMMKRAIKEGFLKLDDTMRQIPELHGENERSGSTAVCVIVSPSHLFVANLGDSRALVSRNGQVLYATEDHKPYLQKERERIVNAGGSVMMQRVNGSLAVSRALGDYEYKSVPGVDACQQLVSPEPDVHAEERDLSHCKDEFLLLACDGVFDVMNNHELCDFVRSRLRVTDRLELICNQILDSCLSKGSKDNMSVILVTFPGAPKVSDEAVNDERQLEAELRKEIRNIVEVCDKEEKVDPDHVLRVLMNKDNIGGMKVPPGAGLHALRSLVETILDSMSGGSNNKNVTEAQDVKDTPSVGSQPLPGTPPSIKLCSFAPSSASPLSSSSTPPAPASEASSIKSTTAERT